MSRTIVIGDIHGCFDELVLLLSKISLGTDDRVVAVGDLVAKGNKTKDVLEQFIADSRFSSVMGNHDLALVRFWRGEISSLKKTQEFAVQELKDEEEKYCNYLSSLPFTIDLGSHLVVHAGIRPGLTLQAQSPEDLTELRTLGPDPTSRHGVPWYEVYQGDKVVLFGHWPSLEPRQARRAIGLDTGCVYGNCLTAYIIETKELVCVPSNRSYDHPKIPLT